MQKDYETRIADRIARVGELERKQSELEAQVEEYCALSDIIKKINGKADITAGFIEKLIERIEVFSDRSIEVKFSFESGFERLNEISLPVQATKEVLLCANM